MGEIGEVRNNQIKENNVGFASTWERLTQEKAENVRKGRIDMVKTQLKNVPFVWDEIEKSKNDRCYIGDYGNLITEEHDFEINQIFKAWGIVDEENKPVDAQNLRKMVEGKKGEERKFVLNDQNKDIELKIDFFSEVSDINFDCRIRGINDKSRNRLTDHVQGLGAIKTLNTLAEKLENPDGEIEMELNEEQKLYLNKRLGIKDDNKTMWPGFNIDIQKKEEKLKIKWNLNEGLIDGSLDERQFLKSQAAKDLLKVMDMCDLTPSRYMISAITEGGCGGRGYNPRYGSGFSELSRVVTSFFGEVDEGRLFDIKEDEDDIGVSEEVVEKVKNLKEVINTFEIDGGAKLILDQITEMVLKDKKEEGGFEYYVSKLGLHSYGACEDSEFYLVSETNEYKTQEDDNFVYFYGGGRISGGDYDVFGRYMLAMARRGILVNGVELPSGFFCRVSEDRKKVEPVRASMFCFEEDEASKIFGKQYDKFKFNGGDFNAGKDLIHS